MSDYKIDYDFSAQKSYDKNLEKHCLDVKSSFSDKIIRHYYDFVDIELLRNMSQDILTDLKIKIDATLAERKKGIR